MTNGPKTEWLTLRMKLITFLQGSLQLAWWLSHWFHMAFQVVPVVIISQPADKGEETTQYNQKYSLKRWPRNYTHFCSYSIGLNLFTWPQLNPNMFSVWVTTCSTNTGRRGVILVETKEKLVSEEQSVVSATWAFQNPSRLLLHHFGSLF